jgi:hypothetical protein
VVRPTLTLALVEAVGSPPMYRPMPDASPNPGGPVGPYGSLRRPSTDGDELPGSPATPLPRQMSGGATASLFGDFGSPNSPPIPSVNAQWPAGDPFSSTPSPSSTGFEPFTSPSVGSPFDPSTIDAFAGSAPIAPIPVSAPVSSPSKSGLSDELFISPGGSPTGKVAFVSNPGFQDPFTSLSQPPHQPVRKSSLPNAVDPFASLGMGLPTPSPPRPTGADPWNSSSSPMGMYPGPPNYGGQHPGPRPPPAQQGGYMPYPVDPLASLNPVVSLLQDPDIYLAQKSEGRVVRSHSVALVCTG